MSSDNIEVYKNVPLVVLNRYNYGNQFSALNKNEIQYFHKYQDGNVVRVLIENVDQDDGYIFSIKSFQIEGIFSKNRTNNNFDQHRMFPDYIHYVNNKIGKISWVNNKKEFIEIANLDYTISYIKILRYDEFKSLIGWDSDYCDAFGILNINYLELYKSGHSFILK